MTPFDAYKVFMGVRLHFKGEYDYWKYGPLATKLETFESRTDKFKFVKLARTYEEDLVWATAFAMYNKPDIWVTGLFAPHICQEWGVFKSRQIEATRTVFFKQDLDSLVGRFSDLVITHPNQYPGLFMQMQKLGIDTFLILDIFYGITNHWARIYANDHVIQYFVKRVNAFRPFYHTFAPVHRPLFQDIVLQRIGVCKWPEEVSAEVQHP